MNAKKGEGVDLASQCHVFGYPTVLFLRADGSDVDRIIGFRPPDIFLAGMERVHKGENTLESLLSEVARESNNLEDVFKLAQKWDDQWNYERSLPIWKTVVRLSESGTKRKLLAGSDGEVP